MISAGVSGIVCVPGVGTTSPLGFVRYRRLEVRGRFGARGGSQVGRGGPRRDRGAVRARPTGLGEAPRLRGLRNGPPLCLGTRYYEDGERYMTQAFLYDEFAKEPTAPTLLMTQGLAVPFRVRAGSS